MKEVPAQTDKEHQSLPVHAIETSASDLKPAEAPYGILSPPTPEPEADAALKMLAKDRETLLKQLGGSVSAVNLLNIDKKPSDLGARVQPFCDEDEHITAANGSAPNANNAAENHDVSQIISEETADTEPTATKPDEETRSTGARSTTALSLKSGNWFTALFRTIWASIFGGIFAGTRRRKTSD